MAVTSQPYANSAVNSVITSAAFERHRLRIFDLGEESSFYNPGRSRLLIVTNAELHLGSGFEMTPEDADLK